MFGGTIIDFEKDHREPSRNNLAVIRKRSKMQALIFRLIVMPLKEQAHRCRDTYSLPSLAQQLGLGLAIDVRNNRQAGKTDEEHDERFYFAMKVALEGFKKHSKLATLDR